MSDFTFLTQTEAETASLGQKLALLARKGDCFALFGTLGMGKSVLACSFIQSLTGAGEVPSPTFTLVQLYDAPGFTIYHFDLYRLKSPEEIFELGMEEALYEGVSLIEWPERMGAYLPRDCFQIDILPVAEGRKISITAFSGERQQRLQEHFSK